MYLVTMQKLAAAKGYMSHIDYANQQIDIHVYIDEEGGYCRSGDFIFEETDTELFLAVMEYPEEYLDITYQ